MEIYLVGGAVRDKLLGLAVTERDWVVVGATEAEMLALGYQRADVRFPVFLHPETGEEYALARREKKSGPGYKGFEVDASAEITLAEDLARRDLTINAMAERADGMLVDPFGGREDLAARLLRHVTPAFVEDPVRLLRIARFAARLGQRGFRVSLDTHELLRIMAAGTDVRHLTGERVWREMRKALLADQPWQFFEVLATCGALRKIMPELVHDIGQAIDNQEPINATTVMALREISAQAGTLAERFAVTFGQLDRDRVETLCAWIRPDADCCALLRRACEYCPVLGGSEANDAAGMVALFHRLRAFQHPEHLSGLLRVCRARQVASATTAQRLIGALAHAGTVSAQALMAQGYRDLALRQALDERRERAVEQWLVSHEDP